MTRSVRVTLTVARAVVGGPSQRPGDVIDVPADEAERMLAAGQACPVAIDPPAPDPAPDAPVATPATKDAPTRRTRRR